jgi:hypothetical protein
MAFVTRVERRRQVTADPGTPEHRIAGPGSNCPSSTAATARGRRSRDWLSGRAHGL